MPNEYLDLLKAAPAATGAAPAQSNEYLDLMLDDEAQRRQRLAGSVISAAGVNPDQFSAKRRVAGYLGYPVAAVEAQPEFANQQATLQRIKTDTAAAPVLQQRFTDADFARLAHDDSGPLGAIETALRPLARSARATAAGVTFDLSTGFYGLFEVGAKLAAPLLDPLAGTVLPENPLRRVAAGLEEIRKGQARAADRLAGPADPDAGLVERSINSGFRSFGQMLPGLVGSVATGNPTFALASAGLQQGSQSATRALDAGQSALRAVGYGAADATAEVVTEMIPVGRLLKDLKAGAPFFKLLARQIATEVPTEMVATAWQNFNEWAALNPDKPFRDYLEALPQAQAETVLATITTTVLTAGLGKGVHAIAQRAEIKALQAQRADEDAKALRALAELSNNSKLRQRAPEVFEQFVREAATGGPVQDVFISANTLAQSGLSDKLAELSPSVAEQMPEALATGGDVRIPVAEFAARIAGTEYGQGLLGELKTEPGGMTQSEALAFQQSQGVQLLDEIGLLATEQEGSMAAAEQGQAIERQILEQLNTAGRFSPAVNKLYAQLPRAFFETLAQRLGVAPAELFAAHPLSVQAQALTGGEQLDQGGVSVTTDADGSTVYAITAHDEGRAFVTAEANPDGSFSIKEAGVPEGERGTGLGVRLYEALLADAFARGAPIVTSDRSVSGAAQRVYEALARRGYVVQQTPDAVIDPQDGTLTAEGPVFTVAAPKTLSQSAADDPNDPSILKQGRRGAFAPGENIIGLFRDADLSTFLHEAGHYFLESYADIARDQPALQGDMQILLDWFGVPDLATWQAMTLEQKRAHHEQFARGFEQYLLDGKAPSLGLRAMFSRFRDWLASVYRSMRGLDVEISPEVRAVLDRMLATDAEIELAQRARGMAPLFTDATQAAQFGLAWSDYQALGDEATSEAVAALEARSLRDMTWSAKLREETIKRLNRDALAQRKEVMGEVAAELVALPVYQAQRWLKTGTLPDGTKTVGAKLSTEALAEMYGDGPATPRRYLPTNLVGAEGLHPDVVAEMFGFASGDAMVRQIVDAGPLRQAVQALTDQRMLEQYGDLNSPQALAKAADEAIHNDVRTRFLATELAGLQKAVGGARVLAKMAKDAAATMIERARVGQLRPAQYTAAATRAGKAAEAALKQGDTQEAIQQKRFQVINHAATQAAYEAQGEVRKALAFFKTVAAGNADKTRNADIVNAARAILAEHGVGMRGKNPRVYMDAVKAYDPELYQVLEPMLLDAEQGAKDIEQMTVGELRTLRDTVESLWYLARRERQVEIDGKLVDRETISEELTARLDALGMPETVPGEGKAVTEGEKAARYLQGARAALRRVESWVSRMDGGEITGGFRRYIFQPISEAADAYRADAGRYLKRYRDLLRAIEPTLKAARIEAPELGYTFGHSKGDAGKAELLHALLHTGNESNKRKLLLGRGWATEIAEGVLDTSRWDAFVARMINEGKLTKADFDFAQGVWDLLEEIKPLAQKTHRDVFGRYFDEITATPFSNQFGSYRGGYVPALADTFEVQDAAINAELDAVNQGNAFMFPATSRGFTKGRVEYNRPLALDLRLVPAHINKALLFAHLEPRVRDVMRILRGKGVAGKLNRYDAVAYTDLLLPWLNRAAKQTVETPATGWGGKLSDRFFRAARSRAGMAAMFANVTNALQQITGFSITALKVKPSHLAAAAWRYTRAPGEVARHVAELSPFMANRMDGEAAHMRQQIEALLVNPNAMQQAQAWSNQHAYFLQSAFQNVVDTITWAAAYDQATAEGLTDADAIRSANSAVRETQGSLAPEDISRFESGPAFVRMFTQFASYFNMQANLLGTEFAKVAQGMGLRAGAGRLFYVFLLGFLVPAWVSEAIVQAMRGGVEDDEGDGYLDEFLAFFFGAPLRNAAAMVPVIGQAGMLLANTFNGKPYDDRISTAPAVSMLESAARAPHSVYKAVAEDGKSSRAIRDTLTLVSLMTGIPVAALGKPLGYAADVAEGRVEPAGPADAVRGAVSGAASPGTK